MVVETDGAAGGDSKLEFLRLDPAIFVLPVGCPHQPSLGSVIEDRAEPKPAVASIAGQGSACAQTG